MTKSFKSRFSEPHVGEPTEPEDPNKPPDTTAEPKDDVPVEETPIRTVPANAADTVEGLQQDLSKVKVLGEFDLVADREKVVPGTTVHLMAGSDAIFEVVGTNLGQLTPDLVNQKLATFVANATGEETVKATFSSDSSQTAEVKISVVDKSTLG